uniref:Uncharacterized protein n=1 Tax=Anguilla anguilla TaxID=7936 RepID=A0A0E9XL63_ANGAN
MQVPVTMLPSSPAISLSVTFQIRHSHICCVLLLVQQLVFIDFCLSRFLR